MTVLKSAFEKVGGVMTENPYRLTRDVRGIGFKTADAIAMKLGVEKTAKGRLLSPTLLLRRSVAK